MPNPLCSECSREEPVEGGGRCATCLEADLARAADVIREVFGEEHVEEVEELSDEEVRRLGYEPTPRGWRSIKPEDESEDEEDQGAG